MYMETNSFTTCGKWRKGWEALTESFVETFYWFLKCYWFCWIEPTVWPVRIRRGHVVQHVCDRRQGLRPTSHLRTLRSPHPRYQHARRSSPLSCRVSLTIWKMFYLPLLKSSNLHEMKEFCKVKTLRDYTVTPVINRLIIHWQKIRWLCLKLIILYPQLCHVDQRFSKLETLM